MSAPAEFRDDYDPPEYSRDDLAADVLDADEWGEWMVQTGRWRRREVEPLPVRRAT